MNQRYTHLDDNLAVSSNTAVITACTYVSNELRFTDHIDSLTALERGTYNNTSARKVYVWQTVMFLHIIQKTIKALPES